MGPRTVGRVRYERTVSTALPDLPTLSAALRGLPRLFDDRTRPECAKDSDSLCALVYQQTERRWAGVAADWLIQKPVTIALIIIGALIVRWILYRIINRVTRVREDNRKVPAILRPFKERASSALQATGLVSERRKQRAGTLGSVLRSIVSILVFVVALFMILEVLKINLAPLIASAGIAGVALGFGAQSLVKDYLAGVFMILEDQYGVGDIVDLGEASGTVENVGLRVTTVRDVHGIVWYIRNGEVVRVGNKSQGWAQVVVDVPVPFGTDIEHAQRVLEEAANTMLDDEEWKKDLLAPPEVLGVEQLTATGLMLRVTVKTTNAAQWRVARELRARISFAMDAAGIASGLPAPPPGTPAKDQNP